LALAPYAIINKDRNSWVLKLYHDGTTFHIGMFPERSTAENAKDRFKQMNEMGETLETINRQINFEFKNIQPTLPQTFTRAHKDRLRQQYAQEIDWIVGHTFLSSI
jgi:hypothetical protein